MILKFIFNIKKLYISINNKLGSFNYELRVQADVKIRIQF